MAMLTAQWPMLQNGSQMIRAICLNDMIAGQSLELSEQRYTRNVVWF